MSELKSVNLNSSATVTFNQEYYVYQATTLNSTFTYNLPAIPCDGVRFSFIRNDVDNTSFLNISSSTTNILYSGTLYNTLPVNILSNLILISSGSNWAVITTSNNLFSNQGNILSGSFVANNGSAFQQFSGSVTNQVITRFVYPGSANVGINSVVIALLIVNGPFGINIKLRLAGTATDISSTTLITFASNTYPTPYTITSSAINASLLPVNQSALDLVLTTNAGGSGRTNVCSFILN